jgi:hypothetical protein
MRQMRFGKETWIVRITISKCNHTRCRHTKRDVQKLEKL